MSEKPVFTGILQIAVVVKDCDATVKKYADDYGIGPWSIFEFNPATVSDMIIEGKPVEYAMRLALADIGGVQWEIIALALVTFDSGVPKAVRGSLDPRIEAHVYAALVMGVRDYVGKNGFPGVLIGLSGGVDSALTLAIAVDALGPARVRAVMLPSRYTRSISLEDAREMAGLLGVRYDEFSIDPMFSAFLGALAGEFRNLAPDAAEENIQARIRGTVLMALSNKFGSIVLTTGKKSEMAVGYATLYGDMAGGLGVLKDISKTLVYRLCTYRNALGRVIPERIITRAPSAELRPDQVDQDSLPPYDALDGILEAYVEQDRSPADIVATWALRPSTCVQRMKLNFYGFDPSYHVARYHFVYKLPKARTPHYLASHRAR